MSNEKLSNTNIVAERKAYSMLKRHFPGTRYARFAGQIVRARTYRDRSNDFTTRRLMNNVYVELVNAPEYNNLLMIGV